MTHPMIKIAEHEGTEEWRCSACGRNIFLEWEPFYIVVLEQGDGNAKHAVVKLGTSWIIPAEVK